MGLGLRIWITGLVFQDLDLYVWVSALDLCLGLSIWISGIGS